MTNAAAPTCALCGRPGSLVDSHLIPDFVVRRLKAEGATPHLRGINPNVRVQSGTKCRLLCRECDGQRFSDAEASFAGRIFHPYLDRRAPMEFSCTEEDRYFVASLVWRAITFRLKDRGESHFTYRDEDVIVMEQRRAALGAYLLGTAAYPEDVEQHLFFSDPTAHGPYLGMNAYLTAANDVQIVGTEDRLYCYATLCGIVVICPLRLPEEARSQWRSDTLLMPACRIRAGNQTIWDGVFGGILAHAAERVHQKKAEMTDRQREKVREAVAAVDVEKFARSAHGRAILADLANQRSIDSGEGSA